MFKCKIADIDIKSWDIPTVGYMCTVLRLQDNSVIRLWGIPREIYTGKCTLYRTLFGYKLVKLPE